MDNMERILQSGWDIVSCKGIFINILLQAIWALCLSSHGPVSSSALKKTGQQPYVSGHDQGNRFWVKREKFPWQYVQSARTGRWDCYCYYYCYCHIICYQVRFSVSYSTWQSQLNWWKTLFTWPKLLRKLLFKVSLNEHLHHRPIPGWFYCLGALSGIIWNEKCLILLSYGGDAPPFLIRKW